MASPEEQLQGVRVLVAEDNEINLQVIVELLETVGAQVIVAGNGLEVLKQLQAPEAGFDMVLMDMRMPETDGLAATRAPRHLTGRADTVVIAMTANFSAEDQCLCLEADMDDLEIKLIEPDRLYATMACWHRPGQRGAAAPATRLGSAATTLTGRIEPQRLRQLQNLFRSHAEGDMALMQAAFDRAGLCAVTGTAHQLKSSAAIFGAGALSAACALIERAGEAGNWASVRSQLQSLPGLWAQAAERPRCCLGRPPPPPRYRAAMTCTYSIPGALLTEREHALPLVHGDPQRGRITVFTREVAAPDGLDRPVLVFLQGGPGFEATRPTSPPSGWLARALQDFRVLLLDQRGTGRSTPVGAVIPGATAADQAEYLSHFRADSIVRDLELIRAELGLERWSLLGQSFGGFTALSYLSLAPEGLREVLITGGLAPVGGRPVDEVYAATWARTREANQRYHARYPGDLDRLRALLRRLDDEDIRLPNGERLTARRFRQTGLWLGESTGFERLHHLLELPLESPAFLWDAQQASPWERNPIYATLHESCYADGSATRWSAHRLAPDDAVSGELLGGEHVFPWMWDDHGGLRAHREAAQLLAEHPWPRLYDADRLARNEVPVAATIYVDDMYVDRALAEDTAQRVRGLRAWITNEYAHNGLRADGERIVGRLLDMVRGRA